MAWTKEQRREYDKIYRVVHREKLLEQHKEWEKTHIEHELERHREWNRNNKEKRKAEDFAKQFPLGPCCWICGSTENLERAHLDYTYPEQFMTLCRAHHIWVDRGCPT